jgi:hypothetical protein
VAAVLCVASAAVIQRADTSNSICLPNCPNQTLPLSLGLLRARTSAFIECYELQRVGPRPDGKAIVVHVSAPCSNVLYSDSFWADLKRYNPPLVLLAMASDDASVDGMLEGLNGKVSQYHKGGGGGGGGEGRCCQDDTGAQ